MKIILSLLFLCSCSLAPTYYRPEVAQYNSWRVEAPIEEACCNLSWWEQLGDPFLTQLIEEALDNNQDLQAAIWRVDQFMSKYGIVRSELFPQISASGFGTRERLSPSLFSTPVVTSNTFETYGLILNGSYQLDLFGELRSATAEACHQLLAEVQNQRTVVLTLVQSVANSYVELKKYQRQLEVSEETLRTRQEGYDLALIRFDLGLTSELQVDQALSQVQDAITSVEQFKLLINVQEDLLSFLIGTDSQAICGGVTLKELRDVENVPVCSPCDLFNQRPDILAQEELLKAANANIGVARALFLPQINLIGGVDTESSFWRFLFSGKAATWDYGVTFAQEIFTGGRLLYNLKEAQAIKQELIHTYASSILKATQEVNDALISHEINQRIVEEQKKKVETLAEYLRLSNLRYDEGLIDYLTVLDAERELFRAQLEEATFLADRLTALVDIYASLGGGWVCEADEMARTR